MTTEPIWNQFLTSRDKQMWAASGYGTRAGFGSRPALVVVDVNYNFTGDRSEPILESIKRWRNSCGEEAWSAVPVIRSLIDAAHHKGLPVIYSTGSKRPDNWDAGGWAWKNRRNAEDVAKNTSNLDGNAIIAELAPQPVDIVIYKHKPSVFFGTPFTSFLTDLGCDSLLVTGTTTSGCVRATVIDAFSYNYRVAVVEDACFDRSQASHAMSLCDMHAKYADVIRAVEVLTYIDGLPAGLFKNLPLGKPR
jgi:maleamate amidohydrolase